MKKFSVSKLLFGVLLLGCGAALLISEFTDFEFNSIFFPGWWTLFLIIPAISSMIENRRIGAWNLGILAVGLLLLADELELFGEDFELWDVLWAGILIYVGLVLIFQLGRKKSSSNPAPTVSDTDHSNTLSYTALFSGVEEKNSCKNLQGGNITAVFGGCEIDLTDVECDRDITIRATAVFGGVDIKAPRRCRLDIRKTSIFGGVDSIAPAELDPALPCITFECTAVFGGVDLK